MTYRQRVLRALRARRKRTADLLKRLRKEKRSGTRESRAKYRTLWLRSRAKLQGWRKKYARLQKQSTAWGGSQAVAEESVPIGLRFKTPVTSRKRASWHPLSRQNPGSDHNTANTNSYAIDFGTYSGANLAHAIARHYGIKGYRTGNYTRYVVRRGNATFQVQILWAVSGHFNHVHLGVRRG